MPKRKSFTHSGRGGHGGSGGIVTINPSMMTSPKIDGFLWVYKNKGVEIVADIYFIVANESKPVLVLADPKQIQNIVGVLKLVENSVVSITSKSCNKATLNCAKNSAITVITMDKISDILQTSINFQTVIHTTGISQESRTVQLSAKRVFCAESSIMLQGVKSRYEPAKPQTLSITDARTRATVALKLSNCMKSTGGAVTSEGTHNSAGALGDIANQIAALKNKLAVLLAGDSITSSQCNPNPSGITDSDNKFVPKGSASDSNKMRRAKMQVLGMLDDGGMNFGVSGRALAVTRWMDGMPGNLAGAPWDGICRQGASLDTTSARVRECVEAGRALIEHFMKKKLTSSHAAVAGPHGVPKWSSEQEWSCLPKSVRKQLDDGVITATGWRPNPHCKDDEEWGGIYGKCSAHNEVVMHFLRPFKPMEVLNTHVCSCMSPAPGNALSLVEGTHGGRKGYDGCLEFLMSQSRWRRRNQTVWDTTAIHFIDAEGVHTAYPKASLLRLSKSCLDFVVPNLKMLTIESDGAIDPIQLLRVIGIYLKIGTGECAITDLWSRSRTVCGVGRHRSLGVKNAANMTNSLGDSSSRNQVQRRICSYLLQGSWKLWSEVSDEIAVPELLWAPGSTEK